MSKRLEKFRSKFTNRERFQRGKTFSEGTHPDFQEYKAAVDELQRMNLLNKGKISAFSSVGGRQLVPVAGQLIRQPIDNLINTDSSVPGSPRLVSASDYLSDRFSHLSRDERIRLYKQQRRQEIVEKFGISETPTRSLQTPPKTLKESRLFIESLKPSTTNKVSTKRQDVMVVPESLTLYKKTISSNNFVNIHNNISHQNAQHFTTNNRQQQINKPIAPIAPIKITSKLIPIEKLTPTISTINRAKKVSVRSSTSATLRPLPHLNNNNDEDNDFDSEPERLFQLPKHSTIMRNRSKTLTLSSTSSSSDSESFQSTTPSPRRSPRNRSKKKINKPTKFGHFLGIAS